MSRLHLLLAAPLLFAGCASSSHDHHHGAHEGHEGHGSHHDGSGFHHGFKDADQWSKVFDSADRDAWQKPTEVVAAMKIGAGMIIADIGAGTGYFLPHLSKAAGDGGQVLGLDIEPDMVAFMTARAEREKLTNVKARQIGTDGPGLDAASVDRILIVDTWHHIDARPAYAAKLKDALKPGGAIYVVDFTLEANQGPPKQHRLSAEAVAKELEAGGLKTKILEETLPDQYIVEATHP
ncbi:class I SAM-dependent methyltransferase [Myxococcota bacterium]|nr:class I SAM-dependent methyltransferase [Myxococcota bacterium]